MVALHQPEPRENSSSAATVKQLNWLIGKKIGAPSWCLDGGLDKKHAGHLIELLVNNALTVKRPCRRCRKGAWVLPPTDERHERFWGRPRNGERLQYVCVACLPNPSVPDTTKPGPKAVPPPQSPTPLVELLDRVRGKTIPPRAPEPPAVPVELFRPPAVVKPEPPPRIHPTRKPTTNTLRLVEHLVARFRGLLTEDMLTDALLGRQVVVYRDGLRTSIELKADELPRPGPEILRTTAERDFEMTRRLVADSFRTLEAQGKLRLDADGSWRVVEQREEGGFESVADTGSRILGIVPEAAGDDTVPDPAAVETYRRFLEEVRELSGGNSAIERLRVQGMVHESGGAWSEAAWQTVSGLPAS